MAETRLLPLVNRKISPLSVHHSKIKQPWQHKADAEADRGLRGVEKERDAAKFQRGLQHPTFGVVWLDFDIGDHGGSEPAGRPHLGR